MADQSHPRARPVWTYSYQVVPPQPETHMRPIRTLLEREHLDAKQAARTWHTRLLHEHHVTHILVVTDNPDQDLDFNRRLEKALSEIQAGFARTVPLPVERDPETEG